MNVSGMRRLVWPFALSLLLHAIVLMQVSRDNAPMPASRKPSVTVSFVPLPLVQENRNQRKNQTAQDHPSKGISRAPSGIGMPGTSAPPQAVNRLDTNQLLSQAREHALKEYHASAPALALDGNYYGTYTGVDSGTFFFHLDGDGHASGTGQSGIHDISFVIAGNTTKDGLIQMSGKGMAGVARFEGLLNIKTREVTGTWSAAGIGRGSFSGRHE